MEFKHTDPILSQHFAEVGRAEMPSAAQEQMWFSKYHEYRVQELIGLTAQTRAQAKQNRLSYSQKIAEGYLRFVILQATRRTKDQHLLKDLIAQGYVGLLKAIERFEPSREVRFLTYAAPWINVLMQEYLHKMDSVHVPSYSRKKLQKARLAETKKIAKGELREYTIEDITTTEIENVPIAAESSVEDDSDISRQQLSQFLIKADLSLCEHLVIFYLYGLGTTQFNHDELVQFFYEFDGSVFDIKRLQKIELRALTKIREILTALGVHNITDIFQQKLTHRPNV